MPLHFGSGVHGCGGLQPSERTLNSLLFRATPESSEEKTLRFKFVWNRFFARVDPWSHAAYASPGLVGRKEIFSAQFPVCRLLVQSKCHSRSSHTPAACSARDTLRP